MFKILAMIFIGILTAIGFFDLGQEAYTLAALLLGIGALLDYGPKENNRLTGAWRIVQRTPVYEQSAARTVGEQQEK